MLNVQNTETRRVARQSHSHSVKLSYSGEKRTRARGVRVYHFFLW